MLTNDQIKFFKIQSELAEKQKELIELQKEDISENKKDRESVNEFTFVLAFGVVVSIFFNLFQIVLEFKKSSSIHVLILCSIFIFLFLFYIGFLSHIFPMKKEMQDYFKKNWAEVLCFIFIIVVLGILLLVIPDTPLN